MSAARWAQMYVVFGGLWHAACGGSSPAPPTAPQPPPPAAPAVAAITVGTAGNIPAVLAPGTTLQLWATAASADGASTDITNTALWRSSNPELATVSSAGLLSAAAEGTVNISATHQGVGGSLQLDIKRRGCEVTLSPERLVFSAFGGEAVVEVRATASQCRWTVRSDASWLRLNIDPNRSGDGRFDYLVPPNSTTESRNARLLVAVGGGPTAVQEITQEKPRSCSYLTSPDEATFGRSGGSGSFQVIATPTTCQWRVRNDYGYLGVRLTGATGGTGRGVVSYVVDPHTRDYTAAAAIEITGLSSANPPGRHVLQIRPR
jgi:hypothetical protein